VAPAITRDREQSPLQATGLGGGKLILDPVAYPAARHERDRCGDVIGFAARRDPFPPRSIPSFARVPLPGFNTTKANYCGKAYPIALSISMVRRTAGRAITRS
jgi:hypothetical protein